MDAAQIKVISETLVRKHEELSAARQVRLERRAALSMEIRDIDRQLQDCHAAARLFGIESQLPELDDERSEYMRRERELRNARMHGSHEFVRNVHGDLVRAISAEPNVQRLRAVSEVPAREHVIAPAPAAPIAPKPAPRPPVREYLLRQLQLAGSAGAKAAELRASFQQEFATEIHEKTVGMTLYRLSRDDAVYRRGHLWFYGADPQQPATQSAEVPSE